MKSNFLVFSFVLSPFYVLTFKNYGLCQGHENTLFFKIFISLLINKGY